MREIIVSERQNVRYHQNLESISLHFTGLKD